MSRCVLGTDPDDPTKLPPCAACVAQSNRLYANANVRWFSFSADSKLESAIANLVLAELQVFSYEELPLGEIVLPSLRWALRRHHLNDDDATRFFYRQFILSAYNLSREFEVFLEANHPQAVVLFNGILYPEAIARRLSQERGIRTITHEVGLLPFSSFFTDGQATAYPMKIPERFVLDREQNHQLDEYLNQRFQGEFSMAGIQFWPKMQELDQSFLEKAKPFRKIVPVFTNVIFDTSQIHASTLFTDMFAWLEEVLALIQKNPETLFVIRAHPDEHRPGTRKQSRESVAQWVSRNGVNKLPSVIFVDSTDYLSSYALIERAHFVMVYNSSIGLEASIMGKPVLCAGAARYTQYPTVFYPQSLAEYLSLAANFVKADHVEMRREMIDEARRVLYFQLFRTALPFEKFVYPHSRMGYVHLKPFSVDALLPSKSAAISAIRDGVVNAGPFLV
jgi:capsule polysaccharide modification protein KpsS